MNTGPYTAADRILAWRAIDSLVEREEVQREEEEAFEAMTGSFGDAYELADDNPETFGHSDLLIEDWMLLDRPLRASGRRPIDHLLEGDEVFAPGVRRCLEAVSRSALRLYEVADVAPGQSLLLRDLLTQRELRVAEVSGSRGATRFSLLLARVVEPGASGQPEIEGAVLSLPRRLREQILEALARSEDAGTTEQDLGPICHQAWLSAFIAPLPEMVNTDGDPMELQKLVFRVRDRPKLVAALGNWKGLEAGSEDDPPTWSWVVDKQSGQSVSVAQLELRGDRLFVRVNSVARAERTRTQLEGLAGPAVEYRMTVHEDLERLIHANGDAVPNSPAAGLPLELVEELTLDHYRKHYRAWIDEELPALGGKTMRAAASDPRRRHHAVEMLKDLEHNYYQALREGVAAYDPSWMWSELGLEDAPDAPRNGPTPAPLAHESMGRLEPGFTSLVKDAAKALRDRAGSVDPPHPSVDELGAMLDVQRFLKKRIMPLRELGLDAEEARAVVQVLAAHLCYAVQHQLHERKTFWVEGPLATLLDATEVDAPSELLRLPFAEFALAFDDRRTLGLAERLCARDTKHPLAGQRLRAVTIYVHELPAEPGRELHLTLAFDALGAEWPGLLMLQLPLSEGAPLSRCLEQRRLLGPPVDAAIGTSELVPRLVQVALNAILYATSANTDPRSVAPAPSPKPSKGSAPRATSEQVFHLPGLIDIQLARGLNSLDRAPTGRQIIHRFMVRGHWRRPNATWEDQRPRWIQPYWKGPDLAATIERAYRLVAGETIDDPA